MAISPIFNAKPTPAMLRQLMASVLIGCLIPAVHAQTSDWKPLKVGKISISYPPDWHQSRASRGNETRDELTPDSMQTVYMCTIFALPLDGHNFAYFKEHFNQMVQATIGADGSILKVKETTFKDHKCMYGDILLNSLEVKVYGFCDGTYLYMFLFRPRRYAKVAEPALERDENSILNSVDFGQ